ncbi:DUF4314 domain-containing protein [Bengtsoniella intestinalis]|uniref:DUF4314 domain-containing protein n=1 Tax=Bengtsoniella intestinalis TaxID=3073143 RepID=UPI00391F1F8C
MYNVPSREEVKYYKDTYPAGTRVRLLSMSDPQAVPSGTMGTIIFVDDLAQAVMKWDNGRTLSLVLNVDCFEVCNDAPVQKSKPQKKNMAR